MPEKSIEDCEKALSVLGLSIEEIKQLRDTINVMIEQYLDVYPTQP